MGIALVAIATLALAPLTALTSVARAEDDVYNGGALTGLAFDSGYTDASFQDVSYRYKGCGTNPAEKTCVWQVHVQLYSDPSRRCVPTTPELTAVWDSAQVSGNGEVHSGARQFALEGCPGQVLGGWFEMTKTFDPEKEEGPWKVLSSGVKASLFRIAVRSRRRIGPPHRRIDHRPPRPSRRPRPRR